MTQKEKLIERLLSRPKDFTFDEARRLFAIFGYAENNKGATSGSRVAFESPDGKASYVLHKPHPKKVLKPAVIKDIIAYLERERLIYDYNKN